MKLREWYLLYALCCCFATTITMLVILFGTLFVDEFIFFENRLFILFLEILLLLISFPGLIYLIIQQIKRL